MYIQKALNVLLQSLQSNDQSTRWRWLAQENKMDYLTITITSRAVALRGFCEQSIAGALCAPLHAMILTC